MKPEQTMSEPSVTDAVRPAPTSRAQSSVCKRRRSPCVRATDGRLPNRRHCHQPRPYLHLPRSAGVWRSPPAICRIAGTTTERTSLSSPLAPESQPRRAPAPARPPDGLVSATAIRMHSPNRDSALEPLPARPGSPLAEKGDGCGGRLRLSSTAAGCSAQRTRR
jgi:hypothetical protein